MSQATSIISKQGFLQFNANLAIRERSPSISEQEMTQSNEEVFTRFYEAPYVPTMYRASANTHALLHIYRLKTDTNI